VLVSVRKGTPSIYLQDKDLGKLPCGPLSDDDPTLELGVRRLLEELVDQEVGYMEQLYTFGDLVRSRLEPQGFRTLSIAYLGLLGKLPETRTVSFYQLFPWEDRRRSWSKQVEDMIACLRSWAKGDKEREWRCRVLFGFEGSPWNPERVLERYELLYGARLIKESGQGNNIGHALWADHRRIAATALTRLRGKLAYRPLVFELLPENFTLTELQRTVEALSGGLLHKQNFRRMVESAGLVESTEQTKSEGRGRPARLYCFRSEVTAERPAPGVRARPRKQ
jgi:hypothetical protein